MTNRNKNKDQFKGVEGSIFGLFPESSRSLYEECVASLEAHYKNPKIQVASTLDPWESSVVSTTQKIQEAEVVIADVTGHDLAVICELGIGCGLKEQKKIILLRSQRESQHPRSDLPLDLEKFTILEYDPDNFDQLDLITTLNVSLSNPAPLEPIANKFVRQTVARAVKSTQADDWEVAHALLEKANKQLPDHWYIHMQWGVMHREKGEHRTALEHFQTAEAEAHFPEYQAQVLIERAILAFHKKQESEVEQLLTKAKNYYKKYRRLYIVWADIYDQLGIPTIALRQILDLMQEVGEDAEAQLLTRYYTAKINDSSFSLTPAEFGKRERSINRPKNVRPDGRPPQRVVEKRQRPSRVERVPLSISWPDFRHRFQSKTVVGRVRNWHPKLGVFVIIGEFKGLLPLKWADPNKRYNEGQEIEVKIKRAYKRHDGVLAIDLR